MGPWNRIGARALTPTQTLGSCQKLYCQTLNKKSLFKIIFRVSWLSIEKNVDPLPTLDTKIKFRWIVELNVKGKEKVLKQCFLNYLYSQ